MLWFAPVAVARAAEADSAAGQIAALRFAAAHQVEFAFGLEGSPKLTRFVLRRDNPFHPDVRINGDPAEAPVLNVFRTRDSAGDWSRLSYRGCKPAPANRSCDVDAVAYVDGRLLSVRGSLYRHGRVARGPATVVVAAADAAEPAVGHTLRLLSAGRQAARRRLALNSAAPPCARPPWTR